MKKNSTHKKFTKRTAMCISVIIGVIIIPLLYSYFYLGAFWDPYSRLETLPVALVNNDDGAEINGEDRNLGKEICDELIADGTLKFILTDEDDARTGTEGTDYYAMIVIPDNFSADVASASTTDKQTATITYSPNEKHNYLASQILSRAVIQIEESVRSSIASEITAELVDNLKSVPDQMTELQDGISQLVDGSGELADGSVELSDGAEELATGTASYNSNFKTFASGLTTAKDGANTLNGGIDTLDSGVAQLLAGATELTTSTANIEALHAGAQSLASGLGTFNQSLITYTTGVNSLITNANSTSAFLTYLYTNYSATFAGDATFNTFMSNMIANSAANTQNLTTLQAASTQLKAASAQIKSGADALSSGSSSLSELKAALIQVQAGLQTAKDGTSQLITGSQSLYDGLAELDSAAGKLSAASTTIANGASDLSTGSVALKDGISQLQEGTVTLQDGVNTSITDTDEQLAALDGLAEFVEAPVTVEQDNITTVPNYGTAFAPYFLSLSLWVGGLIIFVGIYYDPDSKFKLLSNTSEKKMTRSFVYLLIGFVQAVVLGIVLKYFLGLEVANNGIYFLSCCLVSLVFISIIQFFMVFLKDLGKFISMLLLILQLTSCGGTFPMETVPKFFQVLYPFMPMTYSVGLLKNAISGVETEAYAYNALVLGGILLVFLALTIVCSLHKAKKEEKVTIAEISDNFTVCVE